MYTQEVLVVGSWRANCYLLDSQGKLMVIDPGDEAERIIDAIGDRAVSAIVLTHCHSDHIGGVNKLVAATGAPVYVGADDEIGLRDPHLSGFDDEGSDYVVEGPVQLLHDGDKLNWGEDSFEVINTPGHTPGSICLYNEQADQMFTGDTLFHGGYGRTDYVRGDATAMHQTMRQLGKYPANTLFFPGHGQSSSIGVEKGINPWLQEAN